MQYGTDNSFRALAPGMGEAVFKRTVGRRNEDGFLETWGDVANRVSLGSSLLHPEVQPKERERLRAHIANASILLSGRHLQHGDKDQPSRNLEVFTNCSTAATSFMCYYLLLNGSGVGRSYDDDICLVDWRRMPYVYCVMDEKHADFDRQTTESLEQFRHRFGDDIIVHEVADSREGWAKCIELMETMAFEGNRASEVLAFDFSKVRPKGAPIKGMQNRPSSGPVPTMEAINRIASLKGAKMPKWKQAMFVDHYGAESVRVGGARRSARIATKYWRDPGILEFINIKRNTNDPKAPFLWSANNSVMVDDEFWAEAGVKGTWANQVFEAICFAAYYHKTGEPGIINCDRLAVNNSNLFNMDDGLYMESKRYKPSHEAVKLLGKLAKINRSTRFTMIVNPCGEITLNRLGAYCTIGDAVPFFSDTVEEAEESVRLITRALIRTNLMDCAYRKEVNRTNRIGVSMTGIHEFAWKFFKFGFRDLVDEEKSKEFWLTLARLSRAVKQEAHDYATELGVAVPHTDTTIKPAGTTSKLFNLTEGAHLPPIREYLRWVQFKCDDPLVAKYEREGYKVRKDLKNYKGTAIIAFPTKPLICQLGMGDKLVTAPEATVEENYKWLMLLEKYWINGTNEEGVPYLKDTGNQISYTIKYRHKDIDFEKYMGVVMEYQSRVKCCSVMPEVDGEAAKNDYDYLPEEAINLADYEAYIQSIRTQMDEDVDKVHVECTGGSCPIDFSKSTAAAGQ